MVVKRTENGQLQGEVTAAALAVAIANDDHKQEHNLGYTNSYLISRQRKKDGLEILRTLQRNGT